MSAENPSTAEQEQLAQKVSAVERDAMAIGTALTRARQLRLGLFVVLFAVVAFFVWQYVAFANTFTKQEKLDAFISTAKEKFIGGQDIEAVIKKKIFGDKEPQEAITETFTELAKNSGEKVRGIISERIQLDMGAYTEALHNQRVQLADNLQAGLDKLIKEHSEKLQEAHALILNEKFKDRSQFSDDQVARMIVNMDTAMASVLKQYYVDEIQSQLDAFFAKYDAFPVAEAVATEDNSLQRQLLQKIAELASVKLSRSAEPVVIPPPAPKLEETEKPAEPEKPAEDKPAEATP
jgi:hypothetical protein